MQEHIKALNENTKAIKAYTKAVLSDMKQVDVEYTKDAACKFCGITYKTLQSFSESGLITPIRRKNGRREYFKESELVSLCESKKLYLGDYGTIKSDPASPYCGM